MLTKTRLKNFHGFSLLEIVVAMGILSTVLVTLIASNNRAIVIIDEANRMTEATIIARDAIERLELDKTIVKGDPVVKEIEGNDKYKIRYLSKDTEYENVYQVVLDVIDKDDQSKDLEKTPIVTVRSFREGL